MAINALSKSKKDTSLSQGNEDCSLQGSQNMSIVNAPSHIREAYKKKHNCDFVLNVNTPFHVREAYKALRTNVTFSLPDDGCKIIAVTSANASEGKSINCLNLAITFAETGAKVLLIDCDLRRPTIARFLGKVAAPGISNVLVYLNKLDDVIKETAYKNLDVIFSGEIPPNPAELLGAKVTGEVLQELSQKYDYIFLDTPPVNQVTDTVVLSKFISGVVVIVLQNSTEKGALADAVGQLKFVGAKILGFILNGVPTEGAYGGYKYSYKYNRYYKKSKKQGYYRIQGE